MGSAARRRGLLGVFALGWVLAALVAVESRAHGEVHNGISELSHRIGQASPRSAEDSSSLSELHIQRAGLYARDSNWDAALADLDRAATLDPGRREVDYLRGRVLLDADRAAEAEVALLRFLTTSPGHAAGRSTRARALVRLGRPLEAAEDFRRATTGQLASSPDDYLERARALRSAGPEHVEPAIDALDEGIAALGPVVGLEMLAMQLELEAGRWDAALARLDRVASGSTRQEAWLARRGEMLERAGRRAEARAAFEKARLALERVPAHRRRTPAMTRLGTRILEAMARLESAKD